MDPKKILKSLVISIICSILFYLYKTYEAKPYIDQRIKSQSCEKHFIEHQTILNIKAKQNPEYKLPTGTDTRIALREIYGEKKKDWIYSYHGSCPTTHKKGKGIGYIYVGGGLTFKEIKEHKALVMFCPQENHPEEETARVYFGTGSKEIYRTNAEMILLLKNAIKQYENKKVNYSKESIELIQDELDKREKLVKK